MGGGLAEGFHHHGAALAVDEEGGAAMVYAVKTVWLRRLFYGGGAVELHHGLGFSFATIGAGEPDKAGIEGGHIARQELGAVARGVDGNEQELYRFGLLGRQLGNGLGIGEQVRGANVGAVGVAEHEHHYFAAKIA